MPEFKENLDGRCQHNCDRTGKETCMSKPACLVDGKVFCKNHGIQEENRKGHDEVPDIFKV